MPWLAAPQMLHGLDEDDAISLQETSRDKSAHSRQMDNEPNLQVDPQLYSPGRSKSQFNFSRRPFWGSLNSVSTNKTATRMTSPSRLHRKKVSFSFSARGVRGNRRRWFRLTHARLHIAITVIGIERAECARAESALLRGRTRFEWFFERRFDASIEAVISEREPAGRPAAWVSFRPFSAH